MKGRTYVCVEIQPKLPMFDVICVFSCNRSYVTDLTGNERFDLLMAVMNILRIVIAVLSFFSIYSRLVHSISTLGVCNVARPRDIAVSFVLRA